MIKFFRKFRQKLLSENKFSKYLIYAIGEIILVVIGILIALGINNNNQYKKNRKIEFTVLQKMTDDLKKDSLSFSNLLAREMAFDKDIDSIYLWLDEQNESNLFKIVPKMESLGSSSIFYPNTGTYDEATSSGLFNNIINDSLRSEIFDYYRSVLNNKNDIVTNHYQMNQIVPELSNIIFGSRQVTQMVTGWDNPNLETLTINSLYKNYKFYKILVWRKANSGYLIGNWSELQEKSLKLQENIKAELASRKK